MLDPAGRVIMLSGASRGIGLAIAKGLHGKGYSLSLGVRRPADLEEKLAALAGERLSIHAYDAGDPYAPDGWVAATLARYGRLDGLVNNAGIYRDTKIADFDPAPYDELHEVNVKGPIRLFGAALPALKQTGTGRVVNLASLSGKRVAGGSLGYSMSKFAVVAFTHQIRKDHWDDGIRACAICPGFVASDMAAGITDTPLQDMTQPEDVAELIATVLALAEHRLGRRDPDQLAL